MKKTMLFLCCICVLMSGCGNKNKQSVNVNTSEELNENDYDDSDRIYFLDFERNLKNRTNDIFTINSMANDIQFIPLETSDEVLLYNDRVQISKLNDGFLVSSSSFLSHFHSIMEFDSTGRFVNYLMRRGQGPNELPYMAEWKYNHHTQLLVASTFFQIVLHSFENNTSDKYTLDDFLDNVCLLNDGTMVGIPGDKGKSGEVETPYLHFLNQEGKKIHSCYYPEKRNIAYSLPEGQILGALENYGLYESYTGDALFKDKFNDTIYRIRSMDDVKPYIIIHRGSLTPTLKDENNPTTGPQKVRLINILDTKKYFFIKYFFEDKSYFSIWDKQTLSLIVNSEIPQQKFLKNKDNISYYRTPNGKDVIIPLSSYYNGKLYSMLNAEDAMDFLPGIVSDDNPVLMIISIE